MTSPILSLRGIHKSFGPVQVLKGVDFDAYPGQVTALVGDNGAGKSTLIKCMSGIYGIDAGEYFFEGQKIQISGPRDATSLGIEIVYQDLALCDNLDIVQNMFLGREMINRGTLSEETMETLARKTLDGLSVRTVKSIRQLVSSLSGGQRQIINIINGMIGDAKIVILDEPTNALDPELKKELIQYIHSYKSRKNAIIIITHDKDVIPILDKIITP